MMIIPLQATPSQGPLQVILGGQSCVINVYTKNGSTYLDLFANGQPIQQGKICNDRVVIVRHAYLGFIGDLSFVDTQGYLDPYYTGFGADPTARFLLVYLAPSDLPPGLS